ncbi:MAG: DUF3786 domain-containing protein [Clostridiales Family XIII bacterium]|jgi:hypothetical protein|nr:DUF3786 domain-containing protein [Clostridiales Family XIII bacterium]
MADKNQLTEAPFRHYAERYAKSDPVEVASRTGAEWDAVRGVFSLRLMGACYEIAHPVFERNRFNTPYEEILLLRFLLEGRYVKGSGTMLAYQEMPWGDVYRTQFKGRVLGRLAGTFAREPGNLARAAQKIPGLRYEALEGGADGMSSWPQLKCDAGIRVEFLGSGGGAEGAGGQAGGGMSLWLAILLWQGDEEFPGSAQVLFDESFRYAFTAEDMAVVGDVMISRLKNALR